MTNVPFLTEEKFITEIEHIVRKDGLNHIEAILEFCKKNMIDVEDIKPLIGSSLKERVRVDAMKTGLMKKETEPLPFE